ncbi:LEA type 2 family protein [Bdellovibrio bacteriovorus]|uniref:LEA type 2 family protein n=1 Tax=Bdellovibrio bacteriovorus TaxID=959 RepID=UPI0035A5D7FB
MKKFALITTLLFQMVISAGCSSMFGYAEEPKVQLNQVYVRDADFTGATFIFVVNVQNPNKSDIKVKEIAYKVFISGKELTEAKIEKPILVPANAATDIEVPLPVKYTAILGNLGDILTAREVAYRIDGSAKTGFFSIPFSKEGKVELR